MATPRFMTLADVADVLNISARQAYSLVRTGELPGIQVGGRGVWRVEYAKLEEYIAAAYDRTAENLVNEPEHVSVEADH